MGKQPNDKFLSAVAAALLKDSAALADTIVLLPSRRAIKYLNNEIITLSEQPVFSPCCITIDDWIKENVDWKIADEISLVYNLYLSYCKVFYTHNKDMMQEPFEQFYFWGKIILADFDDVDKHLADSQMLYRNLNQYKGAGEEFDVLSDEQKQLLEQFFASFNGGKSSSIKTNFVTIWNCLAEIYADFRERLIKEGLAYSGMLYREAYERLCRNEIKVDGQKFAICGFNVLSTSEQKIFEYLKTNAQTSFYWDYDRYYTDNPLQEAGLFMRDNILRFPNADFNIADFDRIKTKEQKVKIISANGEILQTSYISEWCNEIAKEQGSNLKQSDMVIILANESLLPVVVRALPDKIAAEDTKVNITMGYPFAQTEVYSFIETFLSGQKPNASPVVALEELATKINEHYGKLPPNESNSYLIEAAYQVDKKINDLTEALKTTEDNSLSLHFVKKTLLSDLRSLSLPFQSDSTDGVQIMGMLESRNLDFRYILFLSASDDFLPAVGSYSTFIPHSIRKAYGLMSAEKRVAVFAYYFYRLFHCAQSLTFVYNMRSDSTKAKEESRFIRQAEMEMGTDLERISLSLDTKQEILPPKDYLKQENHIEQLLKKEYLSAAFLNTFLDCGLKMYFKYIVRLKSIAYEQEDISALAFGNLFHNSAKIVCEKQLTTDTKGLYDALEEAFNALESDEERNIISQIHKDIVVKYLQILIEYNQSQARKPLLLEEEVIKSVNIEANGRKYAVKFGGRIDRIDLEGNNLVVVDYKTGGDIQKFKDMDTLFRNAEGERASYIFQVLFYCWLLWDNEFMKQKGITFSSIKPQILYIHKLKAETDKDFTPSYEGKPLIYDAELHNEFDGWLKDCVQDMLSFNQSATYWRNCNEDNCRYCEYAVLCK
ncbi:MAG: PD-(D/E)XK nuclease family protein [Bacteroidales bacterium]|jgi:hypothetical protein|nr:PD-(D/E)XK nuclease family protein [Bacteroidales bacterium]